MRLSISLVLPLLLSVSLAAEPRSGKKIRVVATIPDLADVAREVGGERVAVHSITRGTENIHMVQVRPSDIIATNKADLFLELGLSLEHSFVPGLLMTARNRDIEPGSPGFVNCSDGWEAIDVPEVLSRGDTTHIHPLGNPHFNLHPDGGYQMSRTIHAGLVRVDPEGEAYYTARLEAYRGRLAAAKKRWDGMADLFRDQPLITYHDDFAYFADYYGINILRSIEPRPGVPPTAKELARSIGAVERFGVKVILTAKWSNGRSVRFVSEKSGAAILEVPIMVGGVEEADSWIEMMDFLHDRLAEALSGP